MRNPDLTKSFITGSCSDVGPMVATIFVSCGFHFPESDGSVEVEVAKSAKRVDVAFILMALPFLDQIFPTPLDPEEEATLPK